MARPDADGNITCVDCDRSLPGTVKYYHRHRDAFKPRCKECRGTSFGVHDYNKVLDTPDGKKICSKCRKLLPADTEHFHQTSRTSDGMTSACKKCRTGAEYGIHNPNQSLDIPEGMWMCSSCNQVLPLNTRHFYESAGEKGTATGFRPYCKACSTQKRNQYRRAAQEDADDELTARQWMFIKAQWLDGGIVTCAYCGDETKSPERDHVQPLSDKGGTVAENIVPACHSCNRSKGDSLVSEWYPDSDVFDPDRWARINSHLRGDTSIPR